MKNLKTLIYAALVVILASFTYSENKISGRVVDTETQKYLSGVKVTDISTGDFVHTDKKGYYSIEYTSNEPYLLFEKKGYKSKKVKVGRTFLLNVELSSTPKINPEPVTLPAEMEAVQEMTLDRSSATKYSKKERGLGSRNLYSSDPGIYYNTEEYSPLNENIFHSPLNEPLSTFSIDVDAASYANVRRFINNGQKPPVDAVRIEEMINYFNYDYREPENDVPFSINTEISQAPWNTENYLVHIGLQGKKIEMDNLPASNIVFLLDVSGSMNQPNKLPLLRSSLNMLVNELREQDKVSIVVYAGAAGLVLPSTPCTEKQKITKALEKLSAGGSTAGGEGIKLAYKIAQENFVKGGNNRIILATDGDFNVGVSSNGEMQRLIEEKRKSGVFLTVLGFGMGNYKDSKMEILADKGNGNYAYIDNIMEAKKVLVNEFGGTLFTIAKDVKIQVEFNPAIVEEYRLIGYVNRLLKDEDFNNDEKDAGELGSGHTVTALYEVVPIGEKGFTSPVDPLKYQNRSKTVKNKTEIMNVKLRYKEPEGNISKLIESPLYFKNSEFEETTDNFRWSSAVAMFGMLLRDSEYKGETSVEGIIKLANTAKGAGEIAYRSEFIRLVEMYKFINRKSEEGL